jgi:predicted phage terminase large subunit-like protein
VTDFEEYLLAARYEAADSLHSFTKLFWHILEPKEQFVNNWHLEAMCEHLQAINNGQIKDLIISVPPRHMKSISVCVTWPAWTWLKNPSKRWIFGSYSKGLSVRDSIKCRRLIESQLYKDTFDIKWSLSDDQNQKTRFNNSETGYRIATSVGGTGTGEGGDFIVVDDPMKATDAESEVKRQNVIDWWDNEMSTRGNNPETVAKVIIMQRLHQNDLAGHCIKQGGYEVLRLPAEYDGKKHFTSIGWSDPRNETGELLWPDRFSKPVIDGLKKKLGSRGTASQLQQDPKAAEDGLFKRKWWKFYKDLPLKGQIEKTVQFWDTAQKPGISNDYSVCATWAKTHNGYYLVDVFRDKLEYPQLKQAIKIQAAKYSPTAIQIEDKSSGTSLIQDLRQETSLPIIAYDPGRSDKQMRASAATPAVESGNCFLPEGANWVQDFIVEHEQFPDCDHDDQVDTTSQMVENFNRSVAFVPRVRSL